MANPTTNTKNSGTKVDHGSSLAGNQKVSNPTGVEYPYDYLPYSAPYSDLCEAEFFHGFACTEAPGKVHGEAGNVKI